jgi:hypothetical protein
MRNVFSQEARRLRVEMPKGRYKGQTPTIEVTRKTTAFLFIAFLLRLYSWE